MQKDSTIRLLIVDDRVEDAEAVVTALRNGGIAVRPLRPQDPAELAQMVAGQPVDLVLASNSTAMPLEQVCAQVGASGKDLPLLALVDRIDDAAVLACLGNGVRALVLRHRPEHLLATVRREWSDLEARRGLRRLEAQLRETERRCDALIASSRDPVAYIHEGMHIRANDAYLEMFGFESFEEVEGMSLLDLVAAQHIDAFKQLLKALSRGEPPPAEYLMEARHLDGSTFPAKMEFATATYEGEPCIQVVFRRREELDPELAREVEELRQRDQVTGLLNRPTFMRMLEDAVARVGRDGGQYGFLLLEPDHYARLLPDIGLDAADAFIAALAERVRSALPPEVPVARFGEDSFAVLVEGNHASTRNVAEALRDAIATHVVSVGTRSVAVTASIGGVQVGEKIASVPQILSKANHCLHAAVEMGGNSVQVFDPGAADRAEEERIARWVERLREALAGDGFVLHYLPVLGLQGDNGELYEAHLRIEVNGELVRPSAFAAIAEEHGLLGEIDRWVVRKAIATLAERDRAGRNTRILVRLCPDSFAGDAMATLIRTELAMNGVSGDRLWLEASEAKVFTHLRDAQQFLSAVSSLGCRMGLEQFGSGLDSFQLLAHFRPAFLKIDPGLTDDLGKGGDALEKVREITSRAQADGMATLAEQVGDAPTMSQLFTLGVDYVSGGFVAPAGPEMNFEFG
ncbi:EAL domain-containing protein [Pseudoxanthomonas sp. SGNA-20]|jgi:PAS domain S-box/diguanylate cyclase (GGDEF) domain|uniref:GGDEF/EAL domain-containing response regulator n=1 Tax=unclassified Pseudoxanthomonas TaxID=2645906 RepID=UPI0002DF0301|nr:MULTISPECIES: EAL domain-containing protein [unclassified Pseudoxanthomonas]RRN54791.1 EAL domain-containing protein [Pseudoxanthomonas sp. SGNA-20]RRN78397.1 EAL domain-containing protein [Pseudoxanthomonas sp. SGD-10]